MSVTYQVKLRNPAGVLLTHELPWSSLSWVLRERQIGALELSIPGGQVDRSWLTGYARLEIWRRVDRLIPVQVGGQWFINYLQTSGNAQDIYLRASDANWAILDARIVRYPASTDLVINAYSDKTGTADNVIKAFLRENGGSLSTDTSRVFADLSIAADLSLGYSTAKQASRKNLLETMRALAGDSINHGTYLTWDFVWNENLVTFETHTGQLGMNHGSTSGDQITISVARGNLMDPKLIEDYSNERTVVDVGGSGTGSDRAIGTATNSSRVNAAPYARREYFGSGMLTGGSTSLNAEASAKLNDLRARRTLSGQIVQTPGLRYGIEINYGDLITAEYAGQSFDCHLDCVSGMAVSGSETQMLMAFEGSEVI